MCETPSLRRDFSQASFTYAGSERSPRRPSAVTRFANFVARKMEERFMVLANHLPIRSSLSQHQYRPGMQEAG